MPKARLFCYEEEGIYYGYNKKAINQIDNINVSNKLNLIFFLNKSTDRQIPTIPIVAVTNSIQFGYMKQNNKLSVKLKGKF